MSSKKGKPNWRGINDMHNGAGIDVPDNFSFHAFIHNRNVILGIIASIIGIAVAGISIYLPSTVQLIGCILGACISFAGVSTITNYINQCTVNETQNREKKGRKNNSSF